MLEKFQQTKEPKKDNGDELGKSVDADNVTEADEDDNDFIMNKVKRKRHHDLYVHDETTYVSQLCLTWEALHCRYTQLSQIESEISKCYNHSDQQF